MKILVVHQQYFSISRLRTMFVTLEPSPRVYRATWNSDGSLCSLYQEHGEPLDLEIGEDVQDANVGDTFNVAVKPSMYEALR